MMRKCHLNTCPVGIATQDPELRQKYTGKPEYIVNFVRFLAMELREVMAELGFRTINEMVGRVDKLTAKANVSHWKAKHLHLDKLLHRMYVREEDNTFKSMEQNHGIEAALDNRLIADLKEAIDAGTAATKVIKLRNINRTVGTMLSSYITKRYGAEGLPEDTIQINATGSCGQSFAAFANSGLRFEVEGDANDYFGKGLSGAKLILYPPKNATFDANETVILGNVAFYGATSGEAYIYGMAGERFCVRNSGAQVVVSAIGDHGCEYMTGGRVVILGEIGKNFAAGMSGGIAYIYDVAGNLAGRINEGMVDLDRIETAEESAQIREMIEHYQAYTGSPEAATILSDWEQNQQRFIKVMPRDYKRVLQEQATKMEEV
jgi:glutamate synthase domain-containing protein 3